MPKKVSAKTVRKILKKHGYGSYVASRKPWLTPRHIRARLAFAKAHLQYSWKKVIFSDEKIFRMVPGGFVKRWRRKVDKFVAKYTLPSHPNKQGLMVWCAINSTGDLCLRRCPEKVKATGYQGILQSALNFINPQKCK